MRREHEVLDLAQWTVFGGRLVLINVEAGGRNFTRVECIN